MACTTDQVTVETPHGQRIDGAGLTGDDGDRDHGRRHGDDATSVVLARLDHDPSIAQGFHERALGRRRFAVEVRQDEYVGQVMRGESRSLSLLTIRLLARMRVVCPHLFAPRARRPDGVGVIEPALCGLDIVVDEKAAPAKARGRIVAVLARGRWRDDVTPDIKHTADDL